MAGIFKAYDIRGIVPDQLDGPLARKIGYAFARELKAGAVAVGNDMRVSAGPIKTAFIEGITAAGCDVIDLGRCATPLTYFASGALKVDGAAMVTASHNPHQYNGFKFSRREARPVSYETGIATIEQAVAGLATLPAGKGKVKKQDLSKAYRDHVRAFALIGRRLKVVVDAGNGMGGEEMRLAYTEKDLDLVPLYFEPDGTFPNHEPNPLKPGNMRDLQARVKTTGAAFGAAFDGDADRVTFTDEQGAIISSDLVTALFAGKVIADEPGAAVIYDLRSSKIVREEVERRGGKGVESRVGHSYIKGVMREHNAPLGGELSGHYYFRENYFADSGIIAFTVLLGIVSNAAVPLSQLLAPLRKYHVSGEINFEVHDKDGKIALLKRTFADAALSELDGVTIRYPDWWFNVRKSNTEPLLRLNLEADTARLRDEGVRKLSSLLKE